jgi:hypothetical protein
MQYELNTLYEEHFRDHSPDGGDVCADLRGPDFVWVAPAYLTAKPRVLFIGQQPDGCDFSYAEFLSGWTVVVGWINLLKFVTADRKSVLGMPFENAALNLQGDLFLRELAILRPHACIFATGPHYDRIIERYYPGIIFEDDGFGVRTLAALKHAWLPVPSFRTYHPHALRRMKKWDAVFAQLCVRLKDHFL